MTIKIGNDYFKVLVNGYEVEDKEFLEKILFCLKVAKITMEACEGYVSGDDMSYLDTSDRNRVEIYNSILSDIKWGKNRYPKLELMKDDLKIEVL